MSNVINLADRRVQLTEDEHVCRIKKIRNSLERINLLMDTLRRMENDGIKIDTTDSNQPNEWNPENNSTVTQTGQTTDD